MLRHKISRFISNGKYKKMSLVDTVQETSKEIVELFYKSKQNQNVEIDEEFDDTPFLTAGQHVSKKNLQNESSLDPNNEEDETQ